MTESINELQKIMDDDFSEKNKINPQQWAGFVESNVVKFFDEVLDFKTCSIHRS